MEAAARRPTVGASSRGAPECPRRRLGSWRGARIHGTILLWAEDGHLASDPAAIVVAHRNSHGCEAPRMGTMAPTGRPSNEITKGLRGQRLTDPTPPSAHTGGASLHRDHLPRMAHSGRRHIRQRSMPKCVNGQPPALSPERPGLPGRLRLSTPGQVKTHKTDRTEQSRHRGRDRDTDNTSRRDGINTTGHASNTNMHRKHRSHAPLAIHVFI